MNDLTLITCSYHTPEVLMAMLRSFVYFHPDSIPQKIIVMENSRDDITVNLLDSASIPYQRNPGATHSIALDKALTLCQTKYALVVDSDILFQKNIKEAYDYMKEANGVLLGELIKSRGGYKLENRIGPWFMFVDVEEINKHKIRFHDQARINATGSQGFFNNIPLQSNNGGVYLDVGSSFLSDVMSKNLKVLAISEETRNEFCHHYEGVSWRVKTNIPEYVAWGKEVESEFLLDAKKFNKVELNGKFIVGL